METQTSITLYQDLPIHRYRQHLFYSGLGISLTLAIVWLVYGEGLFSSICSLILFISLSRTPNRPLCRFHNGVLSLYLNKQTDITISSIKRFIWCNPHRTLAFIMDNDQVIELNNSSELAHSQRISRFIQKHLPDSVEQVERQSLSLREQQHGIYNVSAYDDEAGT